MQRRFFDDSAVHSVNLILFHGHMGKELLNAVGLFDLPGIGSEPFIVQRYIEGNTVRVAVEVAVAAGEVWSAVILRVLWGKPRDRMAGSFEKVAAGSGGFFPKLTILFWPPERKQLIEMG